MKPPGTTYHGPLIIEASDDNGATWYPVTRFTHATLTSPTPAQVSEPDPTAVIPTEFAVHGELVIIDDPPPRDQATITETTYRFEWNDQTIPAAAFITIDQTIPVFDFDAPHPPVSLHVTFFPKRADIGPLRETTW